MVVRGEGGWARVLGVKELCMKHPGGDEEVEARVRAPEGVESGVGGVG